MTTTLKERLVLTDDNSKSLYEDYKEICEEITEKIQNLNNLIETLKEIKDTYEDSIALMDKMELWGNDLQDFIEIIEKVENIGE